MWLEHPAPVRLWSVPLPVFRFIHRGARGEEEDCSLFPSMFDVGRSKFDVRKSRTPPTKGQGQAGDPDLMERVSVGSSLVRRRLKNWNFGPPFTDPFTGGNASFPSASVKASILSLQARSRRLMNKLDGIRSLE